MGKTKIVLQFLLMFLLYNLIILYIGWNIFTWLEVLLPSVYVPVLTALLLIVAYSYFAGHLIRSIPLFRIVGSYWLGFLQYAVLILPLADLIAYIISRYTDADKTIAMIGIATFIVFAYLLIAGSYNAYSPVIKQYELMIPKTAAKPSKLRIAMASDMHFGTLSGDAHLNRLVERINGLTPDIILFPGDIIDDDPVPFLRKKMGDKMMELTAPLGIYGVLGNHEYYGNKIPEFLEEMNRVGVKILMDETEVIDDRFILIGRKDKTDTKRLPIKELVKQKPADFPVIMMDHQPAELVQAMEEGIDLSLSGHTHRGQMAPNHFITRRVFELDWGYKQKEQLHAIVSSGYGFWGPPIRLGSRSEIVCIDIEFV